MSKKVTQTTDNISTALAALPPIGSTELTSQESALAELKRLSGLRKLAEEAQRKLMAPIKELLGGYLREVREQESAVRNWLNERIAEQQALAEKEVARKAQRLERQGKVGQALAVREIARADAVDLPTQTRWTMEIVDANAVPREYCIPDEIKLRKLAGPNHPEIPGVAFASVTTVRAV